MAEVGIEVAVGWTVGDRSGGRRARGRSVHGDGIRRRDDAIEGEKLDVVDGDVSVAPARRNGFEDDLVGRRDVLQRHGGLVPQVGALAAQRPLEDAVEHAGLGLADENVQLACRGAKSGN